MRNPKPFPKLPGWKSAMETYHETATDPESQSTEEIMADEKAMGPVFGEKDYLPAANDDIKEPNKEHAADGHPRYYDLESGRFIRLDSLGLETESVHPYNYRDALPTEIIIPRQTMPSMSAAPPWYKRLFYDFKANWHTGEFISHPSDSHYEFIGGPSGNFVSGGRWVRAQNYQYTGAASVGYLLAGHAYHKVGKGIYLFGKGLTYDNAVTAYNLGADPIGTVQGAYQDIIEFPERFNALETHRQREAMMHAILTAFAVRRLPKLPAKAVPSKIRKWYNRGSELDDLVWKLNKEERKFFTRTNYSYTDDFFTQNIKNSLALTDAEQVAKRIQIGRNVLGSRDAFWARRMLRGFYPDKFMGVKLPGGLLQTGPDHAFRDMTQGLGNAMRHPYMVGPADALYQNIEEGRYRPPRERYSP